MLYNALRLALFRMDPERSHTLALSSLQALCGNPLVQPLMQRLQAGAAARAPIECMGLRFPNAIGLAAGLDKNGDYIDGLAALGFGFIEIGTVTPRAQQGNAQPRLFRLTPERAIINRMGFNNKGVDYLLERVRHRRYSGILGINIGKNADTPVDRANEDYLHCLRKVYPCADYITVNISSPNTPGLRDLQHGDKLRALFAALKEEQQTLQAKHQRYTPLAIKIAPDMNEEEIEQFADEALAAQIDAVIATNTTFSRDGVGGSRHGDENGGLSGAPLGPLADRTLSLLGTRLAGRIPLIGVGGIMDAEDAVGKLRSGASLVQIYTGLIYQGPALIRQLHRTL